MVADPLVYYDLCTQPSTVHNGCMFFLLSGRAIVYSMYVGTQSVSMQLAY